jgi:hypothetical protein
MSIVWAGNKAKKLGSARQELLGSRLARVAPALTGPWLARAGASTNRGSRPPAIARARGLPEAAYGARGPLAIWRVGGLICPT